MNGPFEIQTFKIRTLKCSVLGWRLVFQVHISSPHSTGLVIQIPSMVPFYKFLVKFLFQFALQELKFEMDQIIFHGWSIGGYPASWAAMNYPDAKGVVRYYKMASLTLMLFLYTLL